jgi:hypothetical protein
MQFLSNLITHDAVFDKNPKGCSDNESGVIMLMLNFNNSVSIHKETPQYCTLPFNLLIAELQ